MWVCREVWLDERLPMRYFCVASEPAGKPQGCEVLLLAPGASD